jgi:hypothetical protein
MKSGLSKFARAVCALSLTPGFNRVKEADNTLNRFNGFTRREETVETVLPVSMRRDTRLKPGVNEINVIISRS